MTTKHRLIGQLFTNWYMILQELSDAQNDILIIIS